MEPVKIRTLLAEDEALARMVLRSMLAEHCPEIEIVAEAENLEQTRHWLHSEEIDLAFLDIQLHDRTSFELLDQAVELPCSIIFTTAYSQYSIEAIRIGALDYLLKPIDVDDLKAAVQRAIRVNGAQTHTLGKAMAETVGADILPERIVFNTAEGMYLYAPDEILRLESDRNYTLIHFVNGSPLLVSKTLKQFDDVLSAKGFLRIHHTHLVNGRYIRRVVKGKTPYVVMTDGSQVEISRAKKQDLVRLLDGSSDSRLGLKGLDG